MENSPIFKFGKSSISMGHGFHGYVSHYPAPGGWSHATNTAAIWLEHHHEHWYSYQHWSMYEDVSQEMPMLTYGNICKLVNYKGKCPIYRFTYGWARSCSPSIWKRASIRTAPCQRWMTSRICWRRRRHRAQMGLEVLKELPGAMKVKNFERSQMQKHVAVINRHIVLSSKKKRVNRWLILSRHLDFPSWDTWDDCSPIREVVLLAGWWFGRFFIFPYVGNNHPNWLSYFSEGLQPPTS